MSPEKCYYETSWTWDESQGLIELWTTKRSVFLRAVSRNPNYTKVEAFPDGNFYTVVWPIEEGRASAKMAVVNRAAKMAPGEAEAAARKHMTLAECFRRDALQEAARRNLAAHQFSDSQTTR